MKWHNLKCIVLILLTRPGVIFKYYRLKLNSRKSLGELLHEQERNLKSYVRYCASEIPYFQNALSEIEAGRDAADFAQVFQKIPILTKDIIKSNEKALSPDVSYLRAAKPGRTGGSTGTPLKYRMSKKCSTMALPMLFRGWGYAGYRLGDKVAVLAGGSLVSKDTPLRVKLKHRVLGFRAYSSFGVDTSLYMEYFTDMKRWRPKFLRGYVSSICDFARFVEREKLDIEFAAVFTTAEVLGPGQRSLIERIFKTEVFDHYGLNDGAITAFECRLRRGMHIDFERGHLEVVDERAEAVFDRPGRILATSFLNKATPFLRYDTGDIGIVSSSPCSCGVPYPLLLGVLGRKTDLLRVNGCSIGSPVLTVLMSGIDVVRYQFVQTDKDQIIVNIEKADGYTDESERFIRESLFSQVGEFDLKFCYEGVSFRTADGEKHKFVINDYVE